MFFMTFVIRPIEKLPEKRKGHFEGPGCTFLEKFHFLDEFEFCSLVSSIDIMSQIGLNRGISS